MGVQFRIDSVHTGEWAFECWDGLAETRAPSREAAEAAGVAHAALCEECRDGGVQTYPLSDISDDLLVDVSEANAGLVLARLGLGRNEYDEMVGSAAADDLLGRVLLALAGNEGDDGVAPVAFRVRSGRTVDSVHDVAAAGEGALWHDAGLRPGYFASVLGDLHALAVEAARLGREVLWS